MVHDRHLRRAMMSEIPINLAILPPEKIDREILRAAIIAEWDAVNLYEEMAEVADDPEVRELLLDIASEERVHVGEFCALLAIVDPEGAADLEEGKEEVRGKE